MRFLTPLRSQKAAYPVSRRNQGNGRVSSLVGRPSWYLAGGFTSPFFRIPEVQNLRIYGQLRELIPLLDVAVQKLIQFVGVPCIEADDALKTELEAWLTGVQVNREQYGFSNWLKIWLGDMLTYGRAHTEIVFDSQQRDVHGLVELSTPTIHIRPNVDGYNLDFVQDGLFAAQPTLLPAERLLNGFHDVRGDDPYGRSLLYSLPFVGEIWIAAARSVGQNWDRIGTPSFQVHTAFPAAFDDPQGTESNAVVSGIQGNWEAAMNSRKDGKVRDFFSKSSADGDVRVTLLGPDGQVLPFETDSRTLMEQITAKTGLPPFMFGLQWATTERLSEQQAKLLSALICWLREETTAPITRLLELRQALVGSKGKWALEWPELSLVDQMETAKAEFMDAQADQVEWENFMEQWRSGIVDEYDVARHFRADLAKLSNAEIDAKLPKLAKEPPEQQMKGPGLLNPDLLGPSGNGNGGRQPVGANGNGRGR